MNKTFLTILLFFIQTLTLLANENMIQPALAGTLTIGGSTPNYATFTAAVSALNSQGVTGPVVFQVRAGTYNEQISISQFSGSSATNTVTFQSQNNDSTSVTLTYPSSASNTNNYTLQLNGADYVFFKQITIQRSGTANNAIVVDITNGALHDKIMNNRIIGAVASSSSLNNALISSSNSTLASDNYTTFSNNVLQNGSYGIYYPGQSSTTLEQGNIVSGNTFSNQYSYGIYFAYQNSPIITANTITSSSADTTYAGIWVFYCDNSLTITSNKILLGSVGTGVYIHNSDGASNLPGLTANNFIAIAGSLASKGIYIYLSSTQNIFYNSVNIYNSNSSSKALYVKGLTASNLDIRDNVFASIGGGYAYYVDQNAVTSAISQSNYNDLFTTGSFVGCWGNSGNQTTLANWKTASGRDNNSISAIPAFTSNTNLHSSSGMLNAHGISLSSTLTPVTTDIDGQTRNTLTPDIGADEFNIEDLGVISIVGPGNGCMNDSGLLQIHIKNFSAYTFIGSIPVYYKVNGGSQVTGNTGSVTINSGDSISYTFLTPVFYTVVGNNTVEAATSFVGDVNQTNDVHSGYSFTVYPPVQANAGTDQYICSGDSVTLTAQGGSVYLWSTFATTPVITVTPVNTTTFIVTVSSANGCSDVDTVLVNVNNIPPPVASFSYTPSGLLISFTNTSTNGLFYNWDFGDGNTSTLQNPDNFYSASASYTVTLIVTNNCGSDTFSLQITPVGIRDYKINSNLIIYPNPSSDLVNVGFTGLSGGDGELKIFDQLGRMVDRYSINLNSKNKMIVISGLDKGFYCLNLRIENALMTGKLLIQ
jgi:parallel beta-helix repeat protein